MSEEKEGADGEVGVKGPDVAEVLEESGDLTGKGIDDGLGFALPSRRCTGEVPDATVDEGGRGGRGMFGGGSCGEVSEPGVRDAGCEYGIGGAVGKEKSENIAR